MLKCVLTLVLSFALAASSFAQPVAKPTKVGTSAPICTGCYGTNTSGEPNDGKPMYQFSSPLSAFAGRLIDSSVTPAVQSKGMRTVRAGFVRVASAQRGTAPPRLYIGMGETVGVYSLGTFFDSTLGVAPMAINKVSTGSSYTSSRNGFPFELLAPWDAYFYTEDQKSKWKLPSADNQDRLKDADFDDRGNVYVAEDEYGWGILKDNGETGGAHLASKQVDFSASSSAPLIRDPYGVNPSVIFSLKSGIKYYAFVSDVRSKSSGTTIVDVTNTTSPTLYGRHAGVSSTVSYWAKNEADRVLAVINGDGNLRIWDYDAYITGGSPIQIVEPSAGNFVGVAIDDKGSIWALEQKKIVKLTESGSAYVANTLAPFPNSSFTAQSLDANNGYVAVHGMYQDGPYLVRTAHVFKMEGAGLRFLDTDNFFERYYHRAPSGYAEPGNQADAEIAALKIVKQGTKTYLMYNAFGIGDVYLLEGTGPSVSATMKTTSFGTVNPNAQPTQTGPFPGDEITFRATTNGTSALAVDWNFGNPEVGTLGNIAVGATGVDVVHQYSALNTTTKITQSRTVTVTANSDSSVNDAIALTLKVPVAQIAIKATGELITASGFETVIGDKFVDASDGSVESHFATWRVGPTPGSATAVKLLPNQEVPVGVVLGPHSVEFGASYGKYDVLFNSTSPYVANLAARTYTVRPFVAKLKQPTRVGTTVTYGATARFTTDPTFLSATQWTYTWKLLTPAGGEAATKTGTVPVGPNIPDFPFDASLRTDGSKVTLDLSVAPGTVPATFETYSTFADIAVPVPVIELTNCSNAGNDCQIRATAATGSTASWQLSWEVKLGTTLVKSGTGNPLATFKLNQAGNYIVTVTETVFNVTVAKSFNVAATLCGPPPDSSQMAINASCFNCEPNTPVDFSAQPFRYDVQDCDVFSWTFGDGGSASGRTATHTFTSAKSYTVRLKVSNSSNTTGTTVSQDIVVSGGVVDPPTCLAPVTPAITKNCIDNSTCKAGTSIRFVAKRGGGGLLSCDNVNWDFGDGTSSTTDSPFKTYASAGTYTVRATISNTAGSAKFVDAQVIVAEGTAVDCSGSANESNVSGDFNGATSGCASTNGVSCAASESITFSGSFFHYTQQTCDKFEWNFGDGSAVSTLKQATHSYATNGTYTATFRVYNSTNTTGVTLPFVVHVGNAVPIKPTPELAFQGAPSAGAKGTPVTFTVNVTNAVSATAWSWDFGDGTKDTTSQFTQIGTSTSIQHTFTKTGTFTVSVKARNAEDVFSAPTGQAVLIPGIVITDTPEFKFLLPVVTHSAGLNNSVWRTDVQIYNPDPTVTPQNPLVMTGELRDIHRTLEIPTSTYTYEDFMRVFTLSADSGPVIITVRAKLPPQIWTRTYNQTETGTFGQFIPAIRIDAAAGGSSAFGDGKYYMAGLRHDARFRTNLGFLNPNAQTITATVRVYDDTRLQVGQFNLQLPPFQLDQFPITADKAVKDLPPDRPFSVQIDVPAGQWLIAYASFIDSASNDPVYIPAIRESELSVADYSNIVIPGVGHVGEWRSDVTVFNPDADSIVVDLAYHDQTGNKVAEAKSVQIRSGEFLHYSDLIKQGVLGNLTDSLGILRVSLSGPFPPSTYPLTFARTYNDKGNGKTFGQGIGGFAVNRTNVKPGKPALVPGIRSNTHYYTNVGLINVSTTAAHATVKLLDPTSGAEQVLQTYDMQPNQSIVSRITLPSSLETGSLKIEVTGGNIWAFCSIVDVGTADPEYVAATPLAQ